jgi:hypothetical protein
MSDVFSQGSSPIDYTQFAPKEAPPAAPKETPKEAAKSGDDYLAMELEQSKQMRSTEEKTMERLQEYQSKLEALSRRPTAVPKDPNLVKPEAAPKQNFTDPMKAFQNPAVVIATLGSLFSRAPLTAAMNASGAAMEAYHKGEAEQFAVQRDEWKENLDRAIQINKIEIEKYDAAWKRSDAAVKDKMAEMTGIAAGMKNESVMAALQSAQPERVTGIIENLRKAQEKLVESRVKFEEQKEIAHIRAGNVAEVSGVVDDIVSGKQPPTTQGLYRKGPLVREGLAEKHFDLAAAQLEWQRAQKQVQSLNGPQMMRFFGLAQSVDRTIDEVRSLSKEMSLSGIQPLNKGELEILIQTAGNTKEGQLATRYVTAINTLREEFANLAQGGYAPTESVWALANKQINANYGVDQLGASLDEVQRLVRYRLQGLPGVSTVGPNVPNRYTPVSPAVAPATTSTPSDEWGELKVH